MKGYTILFIFPLVLLSFYTNGYSHGKHDGKWRWWKDSAVVDELELSGEQKLKIEQISSSYKDRFEKLRTGVDVKRTAFSETMKNPNSTRDNIFKAYDELWDAKYEMKKAKLEQKVDMREVLTTDQTTKLFEIREQHRQKMMDKKQKT